MKKRLLVILPVLLALLFSGCASGGAGEDPQRVRSLYGENQRVSGEYDPALAADCNNGTFLGKEKNAVVSYKGIPYAEAPVGNLRWKAPVLAKDGDGIYEAYYYGKSPIQTEWPSELGSYYPQGEDCLTLNVWTSPKVSGDKTVMVFFHGGSYGWGAVSDPLYDGQNFVAAHPDVVLVTVEYRTGILGFMDFSEVEGGDAYRESGNLGMLDMACALRWIHNNIAAFGGDPDQVTIFGESAGGGAVSLLPLMKEADGLFQRVIAESGSVALTYSREECLRLTQMLLKESGAKTMEELVALPEETLVKLNESLNDYNNFPERDGVVLPEDLYAAYADGKAAHVDMLIGTNADEARYWIEEMGYTVPGVPGKLTYSLAVPVMYGSNTKNFSDADKANVKAFMALQTDRRIWNLTEFYNEILFRVPALYQTEANAGNGGKSYVYYWNYPSAIPDLGACHAVELAYVFNNLDETIYTGNNVDASLAAEVQQMWINFAKTGDPSTEDNNWPSYNEDTRTCMVLDQKIHTENDLLGEQRNYIEPLLSYHLNGCYTNLDYAVPAVYLYVAVVLLVLALLIAVCVWIGKARKKKRKQAPR
ncbi:MAG: carboxylesterase/lipase family protein [Clostridia bacterium]|nr:carboxylesterase/lipase family protein [Clostridia bacterium]